MSAGDGEREPVVGGPDQAQSPATGEEQKRLLPDWTLGGWALAAWTALVLAAVIVGEVWNALTWTSPNANDIMPVSSGAIAVAVAILGFAVWVAGLIVCWIVFGVIRALLARRELRAYERERGQRGSVL